MGNVREAFAREVVASPDDEECDEGTNDEKGALDPGLVAIAFEPAAGEVDANDGRGRDRERGDEGAEEGDGE